MKLPAFDYAAPATLREALDLLAAMAPTLEQAIEVALGKAYVILDGGLLRIDRIGMTAKADRAVLMKCSYGVQ